MKKIRMNFQIWIIRKILKEIFRNQLMFGKILGVFRNLQNYQSFTVVRNHQNFKFVGIY